MPSARPARTPKRIYVETHVRGDLARIWQLTQDPAEHARWDLRFTEIAHLPTPAGEPQRFRYAVRLPGLTLAGLGVTVGESQRADGSRTSALRFRSNQALSPIRSGSGYWRYVPVEGGTQFLTGYDYEPGPQGRLLDALVVRPIVGAMTAWSFDRLRLWIDCGLTPEASRWRSLGVVGARSIGVGVAVVTLDAPWSVIVAVAALLLPLPIERPRARRCLRRAPDRHAASAPSSLAAMAPP